ncbi:MAG: winged helix-turn-helix domain-containing protein [Dehalococcoidia bacterium]
MAEPRVRRRAPALPASDPPPRVSKPAATSAPSASLDSLIHERTRLGIVSALAANETLSFADLKAALNATDGNISAHTRKLEEAGYIVANKRFEGRVPRTEYQLTAAGREALAKYVEHMEGLLRSLRR